MPCTELVRLELYQPVAAVMPNTVAALHAAARGLLPAVLAAEGRARSNVELDEAGEAREAALTEAAPKILEPTFFMALTWSVGGTCDAAGRLASSTSSTDLSRAKIKENGTGG